MTRKIQQGYHRLPDVIAAVLICAAFLLFYAMTAAHGISWGDNAYRQICLIKCHVPVEDSLALSHPLYILSASGMLHALCYFFGTEPAFFYANLTGGIFAALALFVFYFALRLFHASRAVALLGILTLGLSHIMITLSSLAEVYTLSLLFLACETLCLLAFLRSQKSRWVLLLALFNGLHFSTHNLALLNIPVELVMICLVCRWRSPLSLLQALPFWALGSSPVLFFFTKAIYAQGFPAALNSLLFGSYGKAVLGGTIVPLRVTAANFILSSLSFMLPFWFTLIFIFRNRKEKVLKDSSFYLISAFLCVHFIFWVRYRIADQMTYLLPTLFFAILLASRFLTGINKRLIFALIALTPVTATLVPQTAAFAAARITGSSVRAELPFRNEVDYFILPWKGNENSAERFIDEVAKLKEPSFIYADYSPAMTLECAWLAGRLPPHIRWTPAEFVPHIKHPLNINPFKPQPEETVYEVRPFAPYRQSPPGSFARKDGILYRIIP